MRFEGSIAVVTGAARGQGAETARRLAAEGATVYLTDLLDAEGEQVASEIGSAARYVHLDVSSERDWAALARGVDEAHGGLDVLVNNAGVLSRTTLLECSPEEFRRTVDVNLTGAFLGMRAMAPLMKKRGGGAIVNVSSIQGIVARAGTIAYNASKFGLTGLSKTAALELGADGIRVNSLHPGTVDTPMVRDASGPGVTADQLDAAHASQPIARCGRAEDMAKATLYLASDDASYVTGSELVVDGGTIAGFTAPPRRSSAS